jgi:uncharacterized Zn-binding protein involved in type VI secretion
MHARIASISGIGASRALLREDIVAGSALSELDAARRGGIPCGRCCIRVDCLSCEKAASLGALVILGGSGLANEGLPVAVAGWTLACSIGVPTGAALPGIGRVGSLGVCSGLCIGWFGAVSAGRWGV